MANNTQLTFDFVETTVSASKKAQMAMLKVWQRPINGKGGRKAIALVTTASRAKLVGETLQAANPATCFSVKYNFTGEQQSPKSDRDWLLCLYNKTREAMISA